MPINKLQGIRIIPTMVSMYLRSRVECFVTCKAHSSISQTKNISNEKHKKSLEFIIGIWRFCVNPFHNSAANAGFAEKMQNAFGAI